MAPKEEGGTEGGEEVFEADDTTGVADPWIAVNSWAANGVLRNCLTNPIEKNKKKQ